jgi:hypothetical protein
MPVEQIAGQYQATPQTFSDGSTILAQVDSQGNLKVTAGGGAESASLTKSSVTMTGVSAVLVTASATRSVVIVSNPAANAVSAIDPTGGTCSLTAGITIGPGSTIEITGKAAQSAMTQIGTNTQVLTVYTGA